METLTEFCPAKINPYLAVVGKRADGFHDLVSVVSPISVGDTLEITPQPEDFTLTCDQPDLPTDGSNLVLQAAHAYREISGWRGGARFHLSKRVPSGAGLGGGSSDAVGALRGLNRLSRGALDEAHMQAAAARVGSDCPLFLTEEAVVMRGRGERVEPNPVLTASLRGREILLMRPGFGVNTVWAYRRLAAGAPSSYRAATAAEQEIAAWTQTGANLHELGFNSFWRVVAAKFPALPAMAIQLRKQFGLSLHLSGSGSACFVWLERSTPVEAVMGAVREAWGPSAWITRASCGPFGKS